MAIKTGWYVWFRKATADNLQTGTWAAGDPVENDEFGTGVLKNAFMLDIMGFGGGGVDDAGGRPKIHTTGAAGSAGYMSLMLTKSVSEIQQQLEATTNNACIVDIRYLMDERVDQDQTRTVSKFNAVYACTLASANNKDLTLNVYYGKSVDATASAEGALKTRPIAQDYIKSSSASRDAGEGRPASLTMSMPEFTSDDMLNVNTESFQMGA